MIFSWVVLRGTPASKWWAFLWCLGIFKNSCANIWRHTYTCAIFVWMKVAKKVKSKPASKPRVSRTLRLDEDVIKLANELGTKIGKSEAEVFEMGVVALEVDLRRNPRNKKVS